MMCTKPCAGLLVIILMGIPLVSCAPASTKTPPAIPAQGLAEPLLSRPTALTEEMSDVVLPTSYLGILPEGAVAMLGLGSISASVSPDGAYFVIWSDKEALLYDFATLKPVWDQAKPGGAVTWLRGGEHVAIGRIVWDIRTGDMVLASSVTLSSASRWSPEGSIVATPGPDSSILLLEAYSGLDIYRLELPENLRASLPSNVASYNQIDISFSPDAQLVAATYAWRLSDDYKGDGNTLAIWNVATGKLLRTLSPAKGEAGGQTRISWSPDSKRVATTSFSDLYVWDVETGEPLQEFVGAQYITWSPDGSRFAVSVNATREGGEPIAPIHVWNNITLEEEYTLNEAEEAILWSPDSARIVTTSYGASTSSIVRDAATGKELLSLPNSEQIIGFDANTHSVIGPLYYSYDPGDENTLVVWNIDEDIAKQALIFRGTSPIANIAWSPDGRSIAGGMGWWRAPGLAIWDVASAGARSLLDMENLGLGRDSDLVGMSWAPDGSTLVVSSESEGGRLVNVNNLSTNGSENLSGLIAYSPDGTQLASAREKQADVLLASSSEVVQTLTLDEAVVSAVSWSPDGRRIALATIPESAVGYSGSADGETPTGKVLVWDLQSNVVMTTLGGIQGLPYSVDWSPDGKEIVAGFNVDTLSIWNVDTGVLVRWLSGDIEQYGEMGYIDVDWSPDGIYIAAAYGKNPFFRDCTNCGVPGKVILWDAANGSRVSRYTGHTAEVQAIAFNPAGTLLASGSLDGSIIIWDVLARPSEGPDNQDSSVSE